MSERESNPGLTAHDRAEGILTTLSPEPVILGRPAPENASVCRMGDLETSARPIAQPSPHREQSQETGESLRYIMPVITISLTAVFLIGEMRGPHRSIPKILYIVAVVVQSILAYWIDAASFVLLWGVQHWLVSIALTAHMAENDRTEIPAVFGWYSFWRGIAGGYWPTVFVLAVGSVVLVPLFDLTVHPQNAAKLPLIAAVCQPLLANTALNRLFLALNFATVFVHFAMDQAVFRFSDPVVRKVTGTLLFARPSLGPEMSASQP